MAEDSGRRRVRALVLAAAKARAAQALTLTVAEASDEPPATLFAPFSPSPDAVIDAVWTHLRAQSIALATNELLVDLGCGDGRWLVSGVQQFGCRALGIELDPALVRAASGKVAAAGLQHRIDIIEDDIMSVSIREARLVIVYAFAESLPGISSYLVGQLGRSAMVLSIGFRVPDWKPRWSGRVGALRWYMYDMQALTAPPDCEQKDSAKTTPAVAPGVA